MSNIRYKASNLEGGKGERPLKEGVDGTSFGRDRPTSRL